MSDADGEKPKAGLLRRWFGLGGAAEPEVAEPEVEAPAPEPVALVPAAEPPAPKKSWFRRLTEGLSRSSSTIGRGIVDIFTKRKLDAASLDDLEDILIQADLGIGAASRIRDAVGKGRYEKGIDPEEVKALLAAEVERTLTPVAKPLVIDESQKPFVILVVGVNGSGKTTTIGKLAAKLAAEGRKVMLAAGDTFRAAAIAQLQIWAERVGADFVARSQGGDAAGLAFDALTHAKATGADVLLMDTAGRLQNRAELMSELEKIIRVMKKVDAERAARDAAGARRDRRPERAQSGRDFRPHRRRHRPRDDQARRHRARRNPGRHRRQVQDAGPFHRGRRNGG